MKKKIKKYDNAKINVYTNMFNRHSVIIAKCLIFKPAVIFAKVMIMNAAQKQVVIPANFQKNQISIN